MYMYMKCRVSRLGLSELGKCVNTTMASNGEMMLIK